MFKRFAIVCAIACILTGCGPSYHWTKSHPLYRQVPYSTLSITGTENAFILTRLTDWDIVRIYLCVQFIDIVKVFIGLLMLKSDFWARNVVND